MLVKQKEEVEDKNKEVEEARRSLEEKAEQLQLTSKYKSEFLANMSHELRTPLNSLLILAQQLYENHEGNLTEKQIRYAKTIHSCGDDLIQLINDILDLIQNRIRLYFNRFYQSSISMKSLHLLKPHSSIFLKIRICDLQLKLDEHLPDNMETDVQRLNQILKNLLSNAFKFTEKGEVKLRIYRCR